MADTNPYLCFYGDDFTGSTDALDALTAAGVAAVLILDPSQDVLSQFPGVQAVGLAGTTRAMSPTEMDKELPQAFRWMADLKPRIIHYKVCSTFDSSPETGSIGRAMEIGLTTLGGGSVPIVVGAPRLGRFVAFANLFARAGSAPTIHRIDRHPVMARHPVTPMKEADLRLHLKAQTKIPIDHISIIDMEAGNWPVIDGDTRAILFDTVSADQLTAIGNWLGKQSRDTPVFCIGSSAVETALSPIMSAETRSVAPAPTENPSHRGPILVVSGSCSPVTARQIDVAVGAGFTPIPVSAAALANQEAWEEACTKATNTALAALAGGRSAIVYTAHGEPDLLPGDGDINLRSEAERIGVGLGRILSAAVDSLKLTRVAVAGGDTSGTVTRALGITALQIAAPISPGAPLCYGLLRQGGRIEFALKGGQMGADDFFCRVRDL
ncbi:MULTISPECIES: four-carbon acid sugar kinase family protein [unclassified Mesorhizobium]|uniref:four-carbon acid sugar kinase family protein n=1 Tax=unclassified Mesorhizobium TaxID=325217 RepID=UPI00333849B9